VVVLIARFGQIGAVLEGNNREAGLGEQRHCTRATGRADHCNNGRPAASLVPPACRPRRSNHRPRRRTDVMVEDLAASIFDGDLMPLLSRRPGLVRTGYD
jgi:hypothetical protein